MYTYTSGPGTSVLQRSTALAEIYLILQVTEMCQRMFTITSREFKGEIDICLLLTYINNLRCQSTYY